MSAMFYSLHRLVTDWKLMGSMERLDATDLSSGEERVNIRRGARKRVIIQLCSTVLVLGLCAFLVSSPTSGETISKLAFIGFGVVFGYWIR